MVSLKVVMLEIRVDYTSQIELPVGEKSYQKITRGHLASNVEMKPLESRMPVNPGASSKPNATPRRGETVVVAELST